jgi:hypothetical protein
MHKVIKQLWQAAGRDKKAINDNNLFKDIGFDAGAPRLGWVKPPSWVMVRQALEEALPYLEGKHNIIFVGMGGSINGVKTVASLLGSKNIYCLDSLDPAAFKQVTTALSSKDLDKTLVVPISKSGTTKETQLIAKSLKGLFKNPRQHFLWLVDPLSEAKLKSQGWRGYPLLPIQVDCNCDIGGRFSSPHTLIFFLPVFFGLNRSFPKLKKAYDVYQELNYQIIKQAFDDSRDCRMRSYAYFSIKVPAKILESFRVWVTQLFQESIGSKRGDLFVKTLVDSKTVKLDKFYPLALKLKINNPIVRTMAFMYYLQNFVAFFAYKKKINFVNQPSVEKYKKTMKKLSYRDMKKVDTLNSKQLLEAVSKNIKSNHDFIEIIFFGDISAQYKANLLKQFKKQFPGKEILFFLGSDWNHHSYQAAYGDKNSFYLLLIKDSYLQSLPGISKAKIKQNWQTLKLISYATYLTLKGKSMLLALNA